MNSIYGQYDTLVRVGVAVILCIVYMIGMRETYKNPEDKHK